MTRTALLAGEAVANSEILTTVLKDSTGRARPADIPVGGNLSDSWSESSGLPLARKGKFPLWSHHCGILRRHRHRQALSKPLLVPYVSYGMAALVGFSRLSLSSHFLSDVFMGGAFGVLDQPFHRLEGVAVACLASFAIGGNWEPTSEESFPS